MTRLRIPALALLVGLAATATALAKDKDEKGAKAPTAMSDYDKAITEAHKSFAAGLADDAIAAYRKAITLDPNRPEGHLFLGGALYQKADWAAAEEALTSAANRAKADKSYSNYLGKALFLTATVKEAQGKTDEAKTAWKAYEDFAKDNPDKAYPDKSGDAPPMLVKVYPGSAIERVTKLENYSKSVNEYAKVKELIMKRQKELGIEPKAK
jgi:tetratricopeptide (TPR) repeat protein